MKAHERTFIDAISPIVVRKCKEHGWGVPSAIIGQACVESVKSNSLSDLALTCFNYFGMKWVKDCGCDYKVYTATEQNADGTYRKESGTKWRKYNSIEDGIEGYFRFIESYKRYKPVMAAKNSTMYATQLKICGWATSINYTNSIINRVKSDNLTIYDGDVIVTINEYYEVGKVYTLDVNLNIREQPFGEKMKFSCITSDAQKKAKFDDYGNAILLKGARVTCKAIKKESNSTWIMCPSGWICAEENGKKYII